VWGGFGTFPNSLNGPDEEGNRKKRDGSLSVYGSDTCAVMFSQLVRRDQTSLASGNTCKIGTLR
jgi:hypothetical protein